MSNASNSEDNDYEVDSGNSSTTGLLGTDIEESDNEDDQPNTEDDMSNVSNSGDEEDEMDNENSFTTSLFGADIQENEEDLSDSEESMLNASRSEAGNDMDSEDLMEGNTGGENI
ncbi:prothymosin alpha-A-like [Pygocentrus nattereri]|uniref:prothymosin alpha-A-like n=1 Tax=Pygocentrus nattereri TaxID=42514 RepID=UPI0008147A42|nr:prothymosin alpha-A-like [Pygocentrus nattereri]